MEGGGGRDVPPTSRGGQAEMQVPEKNDVLLLVDEKFDFDLSLSSLSANEDDEVFFGPVGHKERCIAASLELNSHSPEDPCSPASEIPFRWSPLTGEKFVEVYKEAHLLALQIESRSRRQAAPVARPEDTGSQGVERFIQESKLKLDLFEEENKTEKSPKSLKRETYCLSDSPLMGLQPSGIQPLSGVGPLSAPAQAGLTRAQGPPLSSCSSLVPVEPSPVHPPNQAVTQKKAVSKLLPPRALSLRGRSMHLATEKPVKEKPVSLSRMNILNEKEPHRDTVPDKPSAAQDATGLPASGSHLVQGKRSLPVPSKLGLKKTTLKPPGCASRLSRKSSSWGSIPGASSSMCASPAAGRAKSTERPSISADSSQPPSNPSQSGRAGVAGVQPALQAGPMVGCGQSQCPALAQSTAEQPATTTMLALSQSQTPEQGGLRLNPQFSLSRSQLNKMGRTRGESLLNSKAKVMATPTNQFKIPKFPTGEPPDSATPRFSRAQRPQSCTSAGRAVHTTPARRSSRLATRTPVSTRRMSTLPTPTSRRLSGLPLLTPKTMPRTLASPPCVSARRLSSEPRRKSAVRAAPVSGSGRAGPRASDVSSDGSFSPPAPVPQALSFSPERSDLTSSQSVTTALVLDEAQPAVETSPGEAFLVDIHLDQLRITPKTRSSPLVDIPLIDFSNTPEAHVALGSESRPLIDLLVNTPDMDRHTVPKPLHEVGQLIDLSSPLIQLSPEANKENMDTSLLRF
ncbi:G2 and S phase-expressed protein 1 [Saccopteryx bilineata]|uniref:G2 and S phase-expressed protein 1 n=1 Tax=Saccopteryx bilineata TaxID=59482 RepID=UPI00338EBE5B